MYILNRKLKAMLKQGGGEGMTSFWEKNWHIYRERESSRLFNLMFNREFKKIQLNWNFTFFPFVNRILTLCFLQPMLFL